MRFSGLLLLFCLILLPKLVLAVEMQVEYGYPIRGPFEATILGTPARLQPKLPVQFRRKDLILKAFPDREIPPVFFYNEGLQGTLAYQKKKAPLVFLIAPYGAGGLSHTQLILMKALYEAGFHVITLPSSTNPNFIITASSSCIPGDLRRDSVDLYRAMEVAWNEVKEKVQVSEFYLLGTSLGATQAAFLAQLDEERKSFDFKKVLLINPSVNLYNSVRSIEELLNKIPGGPDRVGDFFNRMLTKFISFYSSGNFVALNEEFIYAVYKEGLFTVDETGALIGLAYRINLAGQIFASDVMTNSGYVVPKNRLLAYSDSLSDYFQVATHISFLQYFDEYLFPYFQSQQPGLTKEAFIQAQDLRSIDDYLRNSPKFGAITNENDFILSPAELAYLKQLFGNRIKVYPWGGHLGNVDYRDNLAYTVNFFKK